MILGLRLIQKLFPFFTVTNQFICKLDFRFFDFPQVDKRPQTRIGKTDRNEDQLNEIRWHNLLFFRFVDFDWSEDFEELIDDREASNGEVHKFFGDEFDDLDELDHGDLVDDLCFLAVVKDFVVDIELKGWLSGSIQGIVHKIVEHVLFGLFNVFQ